MKKFIITAWVPTIVVVFILGTFSSWAVKAEDTRHSSEKHQYLNTVHPGFLITPNAAQEWHQVKDKFGPTYSGNKSWQEFLMFMEKKLEGFGVVDLTKNKWTYDRWYTSEWPDDSNWTLISGGQQVKVAHYAAYSGATGSEGLTTELALFDPKAPLASYAGKIIVVPVTPHPNPPLADSYKKWFTLNDYEYLSDADTFQPLFTKVPVSSSTAYDVWWQLRQTIKINKILAESKAAGGIVVFDMGYDRLVGLYTFPILNLLNSPTLYLDRKAGAKVVSDAKKGKIATLKLIAKVEKTETYQLIGYLPGKNFGTPQDEKILLTTHTDGPSISQDNGALGLLGVVAYFSNFSRSERPRTLMIYLDNRHYMPGMERGQAKHDWFTKHPESKKSVVALIAMEHLGQVEYKEDGDRYLPSGLVEPSFLWTRNNQMLIDKAIKAVKDNKWSRVMVQSIERPGIHGGTQGVWYGMGKIALTWDLPAYSTMGSQSAYWSTNGRLDKFDKNHFVTQVSSFSQLTGELMLMSFK